MTFFTTAAAFLGGWLMSSYSYILSLVFLTVRIQPDSANQFFKKFEDVQKKSLWLFSKTVGNDGKAPSADNELLWCHNKFIWFGCNEQMLQAGYQSKQTVITLTAFRWHAKWLIEFCEVLCTPNKSDPYVYMNSGAWFQRFNTVPSPPPKYILPEQAVSFVETCKKVASGELDKTGIILCGAPGNGKSSFVKYLAYNLQMDLLAINVETEMQNNQILSLFRDMLNRERPCIVLFEDFDNLFNGRKAVNPAAKYTFDAILNGLDGAYFQHTNTIFIMTTNHLDRIDWALRRPGRFDQIVNFDKPSTNDIRLLLPEAEESVIEAAEGMTMAEIGALSKLTLTIDNVQKLKAMFTEPDVVTPASSEEEEVTPSRVFRIDLPEFVPMHV